MTITIKRQRTIVEFCVDLSLQVDWERATQELQLIQQKPNPMLNNPDLAAAVQAVTDTEDAMKGSILLFELEALPRKKWQEFEAGNPPRDGNKEDEVWGVDVSTFFDAVIPTSIITVTEKVSGKVVDFDPAAEWMPLADEMTDGQYNDFGLKTMRMNRGNSGVPFSPAASLLTAASAKS